VPHFRDQINHLTKSQLCELALALREEILQLRPDEAVDVPIYETRWLVEPLQVEVAAKFEAAKPLRLLLVTHSETIPEIDVDRRIQLQHMVIDPRLCWAPQALAARLQGQVGGFDVLAYFTPAESGESARMSCADTAQEMQDRWCTALALAAALVDVVRSPKLWLITRCGQSLPGDEGDVDVGQSPLIGLGKSLSLEHPLIWGGCIDIDHSSQALAQALTEIVSGSENDEVAYRAGVRYAPVLQRFKAPESTVPVRLRPDASYLVTGGMGGIGCLLVEHLLAHGVPRVVVFGRRGAEVPEHAPLLARWRQTYPNAKVELIQVDLGDMAAVTHAIADLRQRGPALRGIFHAAGSSEQVPLTKLDRVKIDRMMCAKALGALFLDALTRDDALDFQMYFSSISGSWGTASLAPYAMANRFLDALSARRNRHGHVTRSIAWGPWGNVGMLVDQQQESFASLGFGLIDPAVGIGMLNRLINTGCAQVQVVDVDWQRYAQHLAMDKHLRWFQPLIGVPSKFAKSAPEEKRIEDFSDQQKTLDALCAMVSDLLGEKLPDGAALRPARELGITSILSVELSQKIRQRLGVPCRPTLIYDYPNLSEMAQEFTAKWSQANAIKVEQVVSGDIAETANSQKEHAEHAIAIIGMACRLPGADTPEALWAMMMQAISTGEDVIDHAPAHRFDLDRYCATGDIPGKAYSLAGGYLDDISGFDHALFQLSHAEAKLMDPQQRLTLETTWRAFEDAGVDPAALLRGESADIPDTGVFFGIGQNEYGPLCRAIIDSTHAGLMPTGQSMNLIAGRIAHLFGLLGPAIAYDTACSSSLVALDAAVHHLRGGKSSMAVVGGVNALVAPESFVLLSKAQALSRQGRGAAFDARADGYVRAEGCVVLVLKRLSDARTHGDTVHAIIRGSAVNHDGRSAGLTAPNGRAQEQVIRAALKDAGVAAGQVALVEAHGTGTRLGDPIEYHALRAAYADGVTRAMPLLLGTVKAFIGHTEATSGLAGLVKLALSLRKRVMPGQLHYHTINPYIDVSQGIDIPQEPRPLAEANTLLGAVSSFGFNGTNAHAIIERGDDETSRALPRHPFQRVRCWYSDQPLNASTGLAQAFAPRPTKTSLSPCYIKQWQTAAAGPEPRADKILLLFQSGAETICQRWREALLANGSYVVEAHCDQLATIQGSFDRTVLCLAGLPALKEAALEPQWFDPLSSAWQTLVAVVSEPFALGHLLVCDSSTGQADVTASCWPAVLSCYTKERPDFSATLAACDADAVEQLPLHLDWLLSTREPECLLSGDRASVPRLIKASLPSATNAMTLSADRSYLVSGGLGGVGASVIAWLLQSGARHIINLNRRPPDLTQSQHLQQLGDQFSARIEVLTVDLSNLKTVQETLEAALADAPPLDGVFHCAATLDQGMFAHHAWSQVQAMLQAKCIGTWNLHLATMHQPLRYFVVFSSLGVLLGQAGQSGYCLSNALAERLVLHRRAQGLPGLAVQWGPWSGDGMAGRAGEGLTAIYRHLGVSMRDADDYLHTLARLLSTSPEASSLPGQVAVCEIDWERYLSATTATPLCVGLAPSKAEFSTEKLDEEVEKISLAGSLAAVTPERRMRLLRERIKQVVSNCLGQTASHMIADADGFAELGIDSIHSMILHKQLEKELGSALPQTIAFDRPTIVAMADFFASGLLKSLFSSPQSQPLTIADAADEEMSIYSEDDLIRMLSEEIDHQEEIS